MAVYLLSPASPRVSPSNSQGQGRCTADASIKSSVSPISKTVKNTSRVSGSRPMPSTCSSGAKDKDSTAQKPARPV